MLPISSFAMTPTPNSQLLKSEKQPDGTGGNKRALGLLQHEVRNHLPFLSNPDLSYVLISTEFSSLLEHSILALTTWESKDILCLKVLNAHEREPQLAIHVPSQWTPVGQHAFPKDALKIATMCPYVHCDDEAGTSTLMQLMLPAAMAIAREGDRLHSHGFLIAWVDTTFPERSMCPWGITVGYLNPYEFLPNAVETGAIAEPRGALAEYLLSKGRRNDLSDSYWPFDEISRVAKALLDKHCSLAWEGGSTWFEERRIYHTLRNRADPIHVESWGLLGEFIRDLTIHPAMDNFAPEVSRRGLDWGHPYVALPIIDECAGCACIQPEEDIRCSTMFHFGAALGRLGYLCSYVKNDAGAGYDSLIAPFMWAKIDLVAFLREIRERRGENLNLPHHCLLFVPLTKHNRCCRRLKGWSNGHKKCSWDLTME